MVNADDVLAAVEEIEFEQFIEPLQEYIKGQQQQQQPQGREGTTTHKPIPQQSMRAYGKLCATA